MEYIDDSINFWSNDYLINKYCANILAFKNIKANIYVTFSDITEVTKINTKEIPTYCITIPPLKLSNRKKNNFNNINTTAAELKHELAHIIYSYDQTNVPVGDPEFNILSNCLEDLRIEKLYSELFPGAKENFDIFTKINYTEDKLNEIKFHKKHQNNILYLSFYFVHKFKKLPTKDSVYTWIYNLIYQKYKNFYLADKYSMIQKATVNILKDFNEITGSLNTLTRKEIRKMLKNPNIHYDDELLKFFEQNKYESNFKIINKNLKDDFISDKIAKSFMLFQTIKNNDNENHVIFSNKNVLNFLNFYKKTGSLMNAYKIYIFPKFFNDEVAVMKQHLYDIFTQKKLK